MREENDDLRRLLATADRAPPPGVGSAADLSRRVRSTARRHDRLTVLAATSAVTVAGLAIWLGITNSRTNPAQPAIVERAPVVQPAPTTTSIAPSRPAAPVEVAEDLQRQIAEKEQLIRALVAIERQRELTVKLESIPDTLLEIQGQREEAAGISLWYARSLEQTDKVLARRQYKRVIELYPDSPVSVAAADELKQLLR